ncbi:MAG: DUF1501 domain-containing protein [Acidobacteriota bacterium]
MPITRREFLRQSGGATGAALALQRFGLINALAQSGGYQALVCIFLFGGNDSNNVIIPVDDYASYNAVRGPSTGLNIALDTLIPITPPSAGSTFGLHPSLAALQPVWDQQRLAVVCNVGPLVEPLTRTLYQGGGAQTPLNLFSHSDQQGQWQTCVSTGPSATGWGGRTADRLDAGATFPMMVTVAGLTPFTAASVARPLALTPGQAFRLNGFTGTYGPSRYAALQAILATDRDQALIQQVSDTTSMAIANSQALGTLPTLQTIFPNTTLGNQLKEVAQLIQLNRSGLGLSRQLFFCSLGGFDTHSQQATAHASLLTQLANAMAAFNTATDELGVAQAVTTFTLSDFARTFQPNGNTGTDHAWGAHHFVMGGAVKGGDFYGTYPTLALNGPDDTDAGSNARGRWIPTLAVDQYAATLASWYGVGNADLPAVFPNLGRFDAQNLGFV